MYCSNPCGVGQIQSSSAAIQCPGRQFPFYKSNATLLPSKFAQPKPRTTDRAPSIFIFDILLIFYIYLTSCILLVRLSQASSTTNSASLNPRPVPDRLLARQFTILYHSAVQPGYGRVGLHIQELFIVRFISPACGGDRRNHAHQILTSALFCCKIYRLF